MKVKFYVDSGANIHSNNESEWLDTVEDLGMEEGEWESMSDDDKYKEVEMWASNYLAMGYEEKDND